MSATPEFNPNLPLNLFDESPTASNQYNYLKLSGDCLENAMAGFNQQANSPDDYLKMAKAAALVGILDALQDISYGIDHEGCIVSELSLIASHVEAVANNVDPT